MQKIFRFILGIIGLDSGMNELQSSGANQPVETVSPQGQPIIVPVPPLKGP
jgi:hypothetical protein